MAEQKNSFVDFYVFVPEKHADYSEIIKAFEALGCYVIGISSSNSMNSRNISVLAVRPENINPPKS
jgi:hypothetical protein